MRFLYIFGKKYVTRETNEAILKSKYDLSAWSLSLTDWLEGRTGGYG